jgi:GT2 family glycosyltransferase
MIGVILVNYNNFNLTINCINSLLISKRIPDLILVVDNASTDDSCLRIRERFNNIVLISNKYNNGFTGANNQGINYLFEHNVEYVWILNNDTVVNNNCLDLLYKEFLNNKYEETLLTTKIYYLDRPDSLWYAGAKRSIFTGAVKHHLNDDNLTNPKEVDFISGCSMFCSINLFKKYGYFIDKYFAYSEDSELCWRFKKNGVKLIYLPTAIIFHAVSSSWVDKKNLFNKMNFSKTALFYMVRNHLWTIRLHTSGFNKIFLIFINFIILIKNILIFIIGGQINIARIYIKSFIIGLLTNILDIKN